MPTLTCLTPVFCTLDQTFYILLCRYNISFSKVFYIFKQEVLIFSYFSMTTCVVGIHLKGLAEELLMSTHNIYFHREIKKMLHGYPHLSGSVCWIDLDSSFLLNLHQNSIVCCGTSFQPPPRSATFFRGD